MYSNLCISFNVVGQLDFRPDHVKYRMCGGRACTLCSGSVYVLQSSSKRETATRARLRLKALVERQVHSSWIRVYILYIQSYNK